MKTEFKKIFALILAIVMVAAIPAVSIAEEDLQLDMMSLFPIEEVDAYINLEEIPLEKLPKMTGRELFGYLRDYRTNEYVEIDSATTSVWANFLSDEGEYMYDAWKVFDLDESVNILDHYFENNGVQIIIGSKNQLDPNNIRYFVDFNLPSQYAHISLDRYIYNELYNFRVSKIIENIPNLKIRDTSSVEVLWYAGDLMESGYEFGYNAVNGWIKLDYDDSVKFAPTMEELDNIGYWSNYFKMIVKHDGMATMYELNVAYPEYADIFEIEIYTQGDSDKRNPVSIDGTYGYDSRRKTENGNVYYYELSAEIKSYYSSDDEYYLGINLNKNFSDYDLKVLKGWDYSEDKINDWLSDGKIPEDIDITKEIVSQDMSLADEGMKDFWLKNHGLDVTFCIVSDNDIFIIPASISVYHTYDYVEVEGIFADVDGERTHIYDYFSFDYEEKQIDGTWYYTEILTCYLEKGYKADDEHFLVMTFFDGDTHKANINKVDKAVVGHYYSADEAKSKPDIKKQLFTEDPYEPKTGYKADYSKGVDFTVFSGDNIWHYTIKTAESEYVDEPEYDDEPEYEEDSEDAPEVGSFDSYFSVRNLYSGDTLLDTYTVPYQYDTYYSYGYQTLLINDTEADMSAITPEVNLGDNTKVYYGDTMENTNSSNYYNKLSARNFTNTPSDTTRDPKSSVRYTVSAQNRTSQKNYWVTAVKKEEGAKLFVNGPDEREIFLNNYFGNVHDIFVANVGDEELTGISVSLDATNIKLDEYWSIGGAGNNTLAPFTETDNNTDNYSGELFSVARIRLVPDGEGEISGTLTITADGQEPRVIALTGTAGNPKIDIAAIHDAVKYVPYSSIITTNNMHDWNRVTFSLEDGALPEGLTLLPGGEIYGVPKEVGEFPVTIKARYSHSEFEPSYAELVLTVKDNSDSNINASVDDGYEITTRLPSKISKYSDMKFVIDGEFSEFMDLWLDGDKLTEIVDYTAEEGSTKITVKSKTFSNAGKGKHTISAEFRAGGDKNGELKTASQNFTIGSASSSSGSSGGGGGGGVSVTKYAVTFESNGGSTVEQQSIKSGGTISVLPTPVKEGYIFTGWYKDAALTQIFDISEKISSKITLYAKWDIVIPDAPPAITSDFADVAKGDWYYDDVQWAYENNIMVGYNNAQFAPNDAITSSMVVTVLARLAEADVSGYENKHFEGVLEGQWYTPYAAWAKDTRIADDVSFAPSDKITREMMGVVLMRFFDYMKKDFAVTEEFIVFADASLISDKAMSSIQTLYKLGIFKGKGNNVIDPQGNTTRAEFATLIHRVYTLLNK